MKRFMGFCKNGGVRHAMCMGAVIALCFSVLCVTGERAYSWSFQESCTSSDIAAGASCEQIISAAAGSTQIVVSPDPLPDDDLQIVLSMGELPESICISWKGEADGPGYIKIACSRKGLKTVKAVKASSEKTLKGSYYRYRVRFDGLEPGEKYHYVIGSFEGGDGSQSGSSGGQGHWVKAGRVRSFRMPKVSEPTQFLYLGDVQFDVSPEEYEQWGEMTAWIFNENPGLQFAVLGGDMVNIPGEYEQWNGFLRNCSVFSRFPLMTVSGNHEGVSSNRTYKKMFAVPDNGPLSEELRGDFYYFDQGSCRFIMTDSSFLTDERKERLGTRSWQLCEKKIEDWIARTLEESPKPWNIVVTHHPPYGMHDRDTVSPQLREMWVPVMEAHGADLVLCGHQHMYMRTEAIGGIVYV
ncbi:MAG: metallophosphoesterase [Clostridia bacterium]